MAQMLAVVVVGLVATALQAQSPLAPTSDTAIVVTGPLHYSSIAIPAGVTVKFVLPAVLPIPFTPAVLNCDGNVVIDGTVSLAGANRYVTPFTSAAGSVQIGTGASGIFCPSFLDVPPGGGQHASLYGSVFPFSLEGGSPGGRYTTYTNSLCFPPGTDSPGGEGGGTIAILAGGSIVVGGTITVDGQSAPFGSAAGSGGSILLRGAGGVTLLPSCSVAARGGTGLLASAPFAPQFSFGEDGFVRIDAWGAPPSIAGTVAPTPTAVELPFLRTQSPPRVGLPWIFEAYAPEGSAIFAAASPVQGTGSPTPFGPLGIDLPSSTILTYAAVTPPGHDPFVSASPQVPNVPALAGLTFWVQAFAVPPGLPARFTNTLAVTVQ